MRFRAPIVVGLLSALAVAVPGIAHAESYRQQLKEQFNHLYPKAVHKVGKKEVGRQVVKYGMPVKGHPRKSRPATNAELATANGVMRRWLAPAPPALAPTPAQAVRSNPTVSTTPAPAQASGGVSSTGGGGGGCHGMSAESGSQGYNAVGGGGKYLGCYQIDVGHYAPGGSCQGLGQDPAGQDQCAQVICRTEGPGAWTNPAGQNPCGRP